MNQQSEPYQVDLSNCDKEPIHLLGAVQPHGYFCAFLPDSQKICALSENLAALQRAAAADLIGQEAAAIMEPDAAARLDSIIAGRADAMPFELTLEGAARHWAHPYWTDGVLAIDLEPVAEDEAKVVSASMAAAAIMPLRLIDGIDELTEVFARSVRDLLGFDRTMVYRFDQEFNGTVINELSSPGLGHSFLGLTFPHSDIPAQARALFVRNRVRAIRSVDYEQSEIRPENNPLTGQPFDLSDSTIRGVSPIHVEYLQNMGVRASLAISLLTGGELWGIIACHHYSGPRYVPPDIKSACVVLCETFSLRLSEIEAQRRAAAVTGKLRTVNRLFTSDLEQEEIDPKSFVERSGQRILGVLEADGLRLEIGPLRSDLGKLPSDRELADIHAAARAAAKASPRGVVLTDNVATLDLTPSGDCAGLLFYALPLEQGYLLALRKEQPQAVSWAGDPDKKVIANPETQRLHPRLSFEKFQEMRRGRSAAWPPESADLIPELANTLLEIVVTISRRRELALADRVEQLDAANLELRAANLELDAFAYSVAQDLRGPLRGLSQFTDLLQQEHGERLDPEARGYLGRIETAAGRMDQLVEDLLAISRITRGELYRESLDLSAMVEALASGHDGPLETRFEIQPGVTGWGDERMLRIVLENLIDNALKLSSYEASPLIGFGQREVEGERAYYVSDNGVGFDVAKVKHLFDPFHRLQSDEEVVATGIGLATVARILDRHGGRIWPVSEPGQGATFYFTLADAP